MPRPRDWTLIVCGGGSGGHLFPAIAVIEELQRRDHPPSRVLFLTADRKIDARILSSIKGEQVALSTPTSSGFCRHPFTSCLILKQSLELASRHVREAEAGLILGTGGFGSLPGVVAGWRERLPVVLLEQNLIPGRATSLLCRLADRICVSFPETSRWLPRRAPIINTGNPVRRAFIEAAQEKFQQYPRRLLILGGSQGAAAVNQAMLDAVSLNPDLFQGWEIIHQTGDRDAERVAQHYRQFDIAANVSPFFENVAEIVHGTAVAVSRAGATSLAEFACCNVPLILIPFPRSARDHQQKNAEWYAERKAAIIVEQDQPALAERLADVLKDLLDISDHYRGQPDVGWVEERDTPSAAGGIGGSPASTHPAKLKEMSRAMRSLARPWAAGEVVDVLGEL